MKRRARKDTDWWSIGIGLMLLGILGQAIANILRILMKWGYL